MIEYLILVAGFILNGFNPFSAIYLALAVVHVLQTRHHVKHHCDSELVFYGCAASSLYMQLAMQYGMPH